MGESAVDARGHPYFKIIHKAAPAVAVIATDITMASAISFAHSQYDTHNFRSATFPAPLVSREILASDSAVCAKLN